MLRVALGVIDFERESGKGVRERVIELVMLSLDEIDAEGESDPVGN